MVLRQTALFTLQLTIALISLLLIACGGDYSSGPHNHFEHGSGTWETDEGFSHLVYDGYDYDSATTDCQSTVYDFAFSIGECYEYASIPYALGAVAAGGTMNVLDQATGSWTTADASYFLNYNGFQEGAARIRCYTGSLDEYQADCDVDNDYDSFAPDFYMEIDASDYNTMTVYRVTSSSGLGEVFLGKRDDLNCAEGVDTPDATVTLHRTSLAYENALIELFGEGGHVSWTECLPEDEPTDTGAPEDTGVAGTGESEESLKRFTYTPMFYISQINELYKATPENQTAYQAAANAFFEQYHPEIYGDDIHLFVIGAIDDYFTQPHTHALYSRMMATTDLVVTNELNKVANKLFGYWIESYTHWEANRPPSN